LVKIPDRPFSLLAFYLFTGRGENLTLRLPLRPRRGRGLAKAIIGHSLKGRLFILLSSRGLVILEE